MENYSNNKMEEERMNNKRCEAAENFLDNCLIKLEELYPDFDYEHYIENRTPRVPLECYESKGCFERNDDDPCQTESSKSTDDEASASDEESATLNECHMSKSEARTFAECCSTVADPVYLVHDSSSGGDSEAEVILCESADESSFDVEARPGARKHKSSRESRCETSTKERRCIRRKK